MHAATRLGGASSRALALPPQLLCSASPRACSGWRAPRSQAPLHTSAPSRSFLGRHVRSLFKWRRRSHPTDAPPASGRLTLFHQSGVPEDLRLPTPGDPLARTAAGVADAALAGCVGCAVAGVVALAVPGGGEALALPLAQGAALAHWSFRDALGWDGGNRSAGKALCGLELALWDGSLATPAAAAVRSAYMLAAPAAALHPIAGMAWTTLLVFEVASVGFTQDARKLGDYALGTRVVDERPGREGRMRDLADAAEVRALRAEVEALAPGTLALRRARGEAGAWYTDLQEDLAREIAAAAAAREKGGAAGGAAVGGAAGARVGAAGAGAGAGAGETPKLESAAAAAAAEAPPPSMPPPVWEQAPPRFYTTKPRKPGGSEG